MPGKLEIRAVILDLLAARPPAATICPSEAARALATDWRPLMQDVRSVAADMAYCGEIEVTQKGVAVNAVTARGPIRLRAIAAPSRT